MHRLDVDLSHTLARQLFRRVGHLVPEADRPHLFGEILTAVQAAFLTRDELAARQRQRLALPAEG